MYIVIDYLDRRPRANDPFALNIDFSEEELISLFTDVKNGVPYHLMKIAPVIRERLADEYNRQRRPRRISPDDISFQLEGIQLAAARGITDVEAFVKQNDSITITQNDGTSFNFTVRLGIVYKTDSRNPNRVTSMTIDQFLKGRI